MSPRETLLILNLMIDNYVLSYHQTKLNKLCELVPSFRLRVNCKCTSVFSLRLGFEALFSSHQLGSYHFVDLGENNTITP